MSADDRGRSNSTYDQFALAIAAYEAAPDISPFSSKFDYALANADQPVLTQMSKRDGTCFTAKQNAIPVIWMGPRVARVRIRQDRARRCRKQGAAVYRLYLVQSRSPPETRPFPYYNEDKPDRYGYTANPAGSAFVDKGVGDFLGNPALNPNSDWARLAPQFDGKFQVSTLRNVDKRPRPDFVKAYMHNGYLKSLKEVVHFYNTRDTLPPL